MKKIYLALVVLMVGSSASFAQKNIKFEVTLANPAAGATIPAGVPFTQSVIVKNLGPGVIVPADSVALVDGTSAAGSAYVYFGRTINVGDTIQINRAGYNYPTSVPGGAADYCIQVFALNRATPILFDTTGAFKCNAIKITGGTGIGENILKEGVDVEQLSVKPNPANGAIEFDYISKTNAEVVASVYDLSGRVVLTNNYGKAYVSQTGYKLDISGLNTGMYFVEIRQEGFKAVGKVSKQ